MSKIKVRVTLVEQMLGMSPSSHAIADEFIASKAPDASSREEEIAALGIEEVAEKTRTIFPRTVDGKPLIWDYQLKGFFKDSCGMLARAKGTACSKVSLYIHKKLIDGLLFVYPRQVVLQVPDEGEKEDLCQRTLRADTQRGERIALASSETVPVGTVLEFEIETYDLKKGDANLDEIVRECLDYGSKRGLGAWRNSGKGRFTWELISE